MSSSSVPAGPVGYLFPGQGSQFVGMASAIAEASPAARRTLAEADDILGFGLTDLIANGPSETLADTIHAQPAILAVSVAMLTAISERLEETGNSLTASLVAGHSLGEFTALVAAESLPYESALRLVRDRGRLMKEAGEQHPGGMAAILGLDDDQIEDVCQEASAIGIVMPANRNCPGQVVISGEVAALELAMDLAKSAGARRAARLDVSIASHSPLMSAANRQFQEAVDLAHISAPDVPIVGNVFAQPMTTVVEIREEIRLQMERPVDWTGTITAAIASGTTTFVEIGPGTVLSGLNRRIDRESKTMGIADLGLQLPTQRST